LALTSGRPEPQTPTISAAKPVSAARVDRFMMRLLNPP
jgi:hypothetical protein